jgi:hypothetical protein
MTYIIYKSGSFYEYRFIDCFFGRRRRIKAHNGKHLIDERHNGRV